MIKKIINFEWEAGGRIYRINWPAVIIIGSGFLVVGLYQYFYY